MPSDRDIDHEPATELAPLALAGTDNHTRAVARPGQLIEVTLQTVGPGSFGEPSVSSAAVRFVDTSPATRQNPGGPGQVYRFEAVGPGPASIEIPHTGPQESFAVDIDVKQP